MAKKKPALDEAQARARIKSILATFKGMMPPKLAPISKLVGGKLYELYSLARLLAELRARGWYPYFQGRKIIFKGSPGVVDPNSPHFELQRSPRGQVEFEIYTDIEVGTIGSSHGQPRDLSAYHEIDIVIVPPNTVGRPPHDLVALGIECKATANFDKAFVREVLGRRRELSLLTAPQPCTLDQSLNVSANPASEYWLVYIDPAGDKYRLSPAYFSVELKHWKP